MKVYLLRHAETDWNIEGRLQGHLDVPLNAVGVAQAKQWRPYFDRLKLDGLYSSPLDRTMHTARLATGRIPCLIPEWRERDVGEWEGRRWTDLHKEFPALLEQWRKVEHRAPGGESLRDVVERVRPALYGTLAEYRQGSEILIVSHGGASKAIIGCLLGLELSVIPCLRTLSNGALTILARMGTGWECSKPSLPAHLRSSQ